jgi:hypothetical protein
VIAAEAPVMASVVFTTVVLIVPAVVANPWSAVPAAPIPVAAVCPAHASRSLLAVDWRSQDIAIPRLIFHFFTEHNAPRRRPSGIGCIELVQQLFEADTMVKSSVPPNAPVALPPLVAAYVDATNSFDPERLMATFAEDALVNDQLRDYWGKPSIREWAKRDIIGERLTMNVTKVIKHYGNFIVTANVDGNYDKRGLPDPLVLAFYFTVQSDLIVQLIILRNRTDI